MKAKHLEIDATRENPWLVLIIPLHNNTPNTTHAVPGWLHTTRVEHRAGGKISLHSAGVPACGWEEHWRRHRVMHPELEPFHRDNQKP